MLQGDYLSILEARNLDEFRGVVVRFAQGMGFDTVAAVTVVDNLGGKPEFVSVEKNNAGYSDMFADVTIGQRDPVMQHCKRQTVPIVWNQSTYLAGSAIDLWERQAQYGYRNGIAMALHMPEGRHFIFGVDREQSLPTRGAELTRMVADLQLFAVHAQDTAMRVLVSEPLRPERPALTPRELEILRWTMDGKTARDVSDILNITERTVVSHLQNAMQKLDCSSKHQAVLKALRLGLIF